MTTLDVGKKLVELCKQGKYLEAIDSLYSPEIVSVETCSMNGMPGEMHGKKTVRGKTEWWLANHEYHSGEIRGPFPNGDRFTVYFKADVTNKQNDKRSTIEEIALYTVANGSIVHETFFYTGEA